MSNALAIATVTTALAQIVRSAVQSVVSGADVLTERPSATNPTGARVRLFLYQVSSNAALRNQDLPARGPSGTLTKRPTAAIDLQYLLAFYGDESKLEPQLMLGASVRDIHAQPVLTRQMIRDAVASETFLTGSNLDESPEQVKFGPLSLSTEDLSKLWLMFSAPYALTTAYQATVLLIESDDNVFAPLPVLRRGERDEGVTTHLGPFPSIDSIHVGAVEDTDRRPRLPSYPSAALDTSITVMGNSLGGDEVELRLEHSRLPLTKTLLIPPDTRSSTEVRFVLPDDAPNRAELAAGFYVLTIAVNRGGQRHVSNQLALSLGPRVASISPPSPIDSGGGAVDLSITCHPDVHPAQRCAVLLGDREVQADARFAVTDTLTFHLDPAPLVNGSLVRVRIEGVDSLPFKRAPTPPPARLVFDDAQKVTIT